MPRSRTSLAGAALLLVGLAWPGAIAAAESAVDAGPPLPSAGCGVVEPAAETSRFLTVGEEIRGLRVHVPSAHDGTAPLPMILWLHGQGGGASDLDDTGLQPFGEAHGIVVAALDGHQPDFGWMWEPGAAGVEPGLENRDVAFVDAVIDQLGTELCLDLARVYATGYSIGGHGASSLACRLSGRVAAVAAASGFTDLGDECDASRAVPMLALAGTDDEYILFGGGLGGFLSDQLPWGTAKAQEPFFGRADWSLAPVERAEAIAIRNGCEPGPVTDAVTAGVDRFTWSCPDDSDVELIAIEGGGHDWQIEVADADANELVWSFLSRFSLPA